MSNSELEQLGTTFISRFLASGTDERSTMKAKGADLAHRLRRHTVELSYSRATEFSPKIRLHYQPAAKVALLVYWPDSETFDTFEKDIRYYANFEATQALVKKYERFRKKYVESVSGL